MDTPSFIYRRLNDLERQYDAGIPGHERRQAQLPDGTETPEEIAEAIAYYTWQARSEWLKVDAMTLNAIHPSMNDFERMIARERLSKQQNRWRAAVNKRDAWVAAKIKPAIAAE